MEPTTLPIPATNEPTQGSLTDAWARAMERASRERIRPVQISSTRWAVRSSRIPGTTYTVTLADGRIDGCDCQGWDTATGRVCKHAGAVYRILKDREARVAQASFRTVTSRQPSTGHPLPPEPVDGLPVQSYAGKSRLLHDE